MRGVLTALGVLAALAATPWVLLLVLGASLQTSEGADAPAAVASALAALVALGCFVASVVTSRAGPPKRAIALLAAGIVLVGGSVGLAAL